MPQSQNRAKFFLCLGWASLLYTADGTRPTVIATVNAIAGARTAVATVSRPAPGSYAGAQSPRGAGVTAESSSGRKRDAGYRDYREGGRSEERRVGKECRSRWS